jgi:hypothetical protein
MISHLYKTALAALLGLSLVACGGSGTPAPESPQPAAASPRSLFTGRILLVGGNALVDYDTLTRTIVPKYFGACVDNEGQLNGNSTSILGTFQLGVLNDYPSRVLIVADEFELSYVERSFILDNYTGAIVHAVASGSRTTIVGVAGQLEFNEQLKTLARAYGAEYSDTIEVSCP